MWANITQRNQVIFYDNDFEVFFNPDGLFLFDDYYYYYYFLFIFLYFFFFFFLLNFSLSSLLFLLVREYTLL